MEILSNFIGDLSYEQLVQLLSTFGLAVVLVLYFVLYRDPKRDRFWKERYDSLIQDYHGLHENYIQMERDLRPESRLSSAEQAQKLAYLGLDRDLYKLYYYLCEKMDGRRTETVGFFVEDTIQDTNDAWSKFKAPFPRVPFIGDLYGVYSNRGASLKRSLDSIMSSDIPIDEKRVILWNELQANTINMKREFQDHVKDLREGREIAPFSERNPLEEDKRELREKKSDGSR